jgi:hypothetical protein
MERQAPLPGGIGRDATELGSHIGVAIMEQGMSHPPHPTHSLSRTPVYSDSGGSLFECPTLTQPWPFVRFRAAEGRCSGSAGAIPPPLPFLLPRKYRPKLLFLL